MYSVQVIENTVKSIIHTPHISKLEIQLYGWNRIKENKNDSKILFNAEKTAYESSINQHVGSFAADIINWDTQCQIARKQHHREEIGIGMRISPIQNWADRPMYLTMIDFNPGLEKQNRHTVTFWQDIQSKYQGHKFYIFNSGNAHHGLLDIIMDDIEHYDWLAFLYEHEEVVDQNWVRFAQKHDNGGVIRTTSGTTRPQPKLWKWVNL
jgi:hypothetical protein